jgi:hypothetical protein
MAARRSSRQRQGRPKAELFHDFPLFPKVGRNKDIGQDDQKPESNVHKSKDPVRKIVEYDHTHEAGNEREILLDHLAGELPEVVLPHGKRTFNPGRSLDRNETDSRQMTEAEQSISYCVPFADGPQKDEYLSPHCKEDVQEVNHHKKVCKQTIEGFHELPEVVSQAGLANQVGAFTCRDEGVIFIDELHPRRCNLPSRTHHPANARNSVPFSVTLILEVQEREGARRMDGRRRGRRGLHVRLVQFAPAPHAQKTKGDPDLFFEEFQDAD